MSGVLYSSLQCSVYTAGTAYLSSDVVVMTVRYCSKNTKRCVLCTLVLFCVAV